LTLPSSSMVVQLNNVSKRYGRRWALVQLTFAIPEKSSVLLTGGNGAGKTTLLRMLATSLKSTRGEVRIFDKLSGVDNDLIRPRLALVTHDSHLYDDLSAEENLSLVGHFLPWVDMRRMGDILERVGLAPRRASAVRGFSAGMRRRLCMGRMLLVEPELVLLDEPFGQLDPPGVALVEEIIREVQQKQVTLVMSTHDVERGEALCDHHLHLKSGRVLRAVEPLGEPGEATRIAQELEARGGWH